MLRPVTETWRYIRTRGLRKTVLQIWDRYIYTSQEWVIFLNLLEGPPVAPPSGIVFRPYTPADLPLLGAFARYYRASELRARLEEGCWLDLAFDGDRPVAFRLTSTSSPRQAPFAKLIRLKADQTRTVDLFCLPEYRGRGIGRWLGPFAERRIATMGYRENISTVGLNNVSSLRSTIYQGDRAVRVVSYFRVLFNSKQRISYDVGRVFEAAGLPKPITTGL